MLEKITYNLVSGQTSGVEDNSGSYEIDIDKLFRRIDLLEHNLNQYFNKWFAFVARNGLILNVIKRPVMNVHVILVINWFAPIVASHIRELIVRDIIVVINVGLLCLLSCENKPN